jgi:ubiquinone/menaquinone biosynthesis C-methylase UbiE
VGAGTGRLERALNRFDIFIYDTNEEAIEIAKQHFSNAIHGTGSRIKFEDNAFDWAISIHTLEHIPRSERPGFLEELIRVSEEGVFLSFPEGNHAEHLCENFLSAQAKRGEPLNKWTQEHLEYGIPRIEVIMPILQDQGKFVFNYKHIRNYHFENFYWKNVRAGNRRLRRYLISPWLSILRHLFRQKKPTVEILIVGTTSESFTNKLIARL